MPCYYPIPALQDGGKVTLHPKPASAANLQLPCGNCLGCKTARSQEWAQRAMHECQVHDEPGIFATLTYDEDHLPPELIPEHLRLFLKRLRYALATGDDQIRCNPVEHLYHRKLRYIASGEYGDTTARPHYHALLYGIGFRDARRAGKDLKTSPTLERLWGLGAVKYGVITAASAAYVASYTRKKIGATHCDADGVVLQAPFLRASTHPGIGAHYAHKYAADSRIGHSVVNGMPARLPRYYRKIHQRAYPSIAEESAHAAYLRQRSVGVKSPERLHAAEAIQRARTALNERRTL